VEVSVAALFIQQAFVTQLYDDLEAHLALHGVHHLGRVL
jgi:hypothetical protein